MHSPPSLFTIRITVNHLAVLTPNRDVMCGQRGVDETVLHDHKNNSTSGIRNIPSLRRDIDAFATPPIIYESNYNSK